MDISRFQPQGQGQPASLAQAGSRARCEALPDDATREVHRVDILQQTAALRAALDSVGILILEDHVRGCLRTAAERGESDAHVDEVVDVVRRTLGRPVRGASRPA